MAIRFLPVLALLLLPSLAHGVTFEEQAKRLQHIYAFLLDLRPGQSPRLAARGELDLSVELIPVPDVDNRVGNKDEPIDPPDAIPRVRARYISAGGLMAGATYNPAVEFDGFEAPWWGAEAGYRFGSPSLQAELRLFVLSAQVTGGITEKGARDEFKTTNRGGDLRVGVPLGAAIAYAGAGSGKSESSLRVASDGATLDAETDYVYWLAGLDWRSGPLVLAIEQHNTENFLFHLILSAGVRW